MDTQSLAEIMERDIARLKTARPRLSSRIERAEHILVTQLSTANGSRPVKVRVHADGSRSYTVRSGCGSRVPHQDLVELHEDNHDNLTHFDGDMLCSGCAHSHGVL